MSVFVLRDEMTSFRQSHVLKRGTLVPGRAEMQIAGVGVCVSVCVCVCVWGGGGGGGGRFLGRRSLPAGCSSALLNYNGDLRA